MFHQPRILPAATRTARLQFAILLAGAALIAVSILVRPSNRDEGQYVAAIALMRSGWPYRDFAFLQTPLQPLLLSPLAAIPAGWLLIAAKCVNGLFALLTAWLLFRQLSGRVAMRSAAVAVGALLCTEPFLFAASQARNDALPILLLAGGQAAMLRSIDGHRRTLASAVAGLLFGLAISAKISSALPGLGAGIYVLLALRRTGPKPLLAFVAAILAGLMPCAILAAMAPDSFGFGVFTYSLEAPTQWWSSIGQGQVLNAADRIGRLLLLSLPGMILVGLAAAALDRRSTGERRMLDLMIVGGVIGAYLPEPAFRQYLIPLLPALTVRLALAIDRLPRRTAYNSAAAALGLTSFAGLVPTVGYTLRVAHHGPDLIRTFEDARALPTIAAGKSVATLSPERVAGSDIRLDPRFAAGPFLFRTFGRLSEEAALYGHSPNWQRIDGALDQQPPGVIVVGGEARPFPSLHPRGLDGWLEAWARTRGYRRVPLPGGDLTAYVRPNRSQEGVDSFPRPMPE